MIARQTMTRTIVIRPLRSLVLRYPGIRPLTDLMSPCAARARLACQPRTQPTASTMTAMPNTAPPMACPPRRCACPDHAAWGAPGPAETPPACGQDNPGPGLIASARLAGLARSPQNQDRIARSADEGFIDRRDHQHRRA